MMAFSWLYPLCCRNQSGCLVDDSCCGYILSAYRQVKSLLTHDINPVGLFMVVQLVLWSSKVPFDDDGLASLLPARTPEFASWK